MPAGTRIRANNAFGVTTDNPLAIGATTLNSTQLALLPAVSGGGHAVITLDPLRQFGNPEIIVVTAHTGGASSATILRGQYGTSARSHPQNTVWVHAPLGDDDTQIVTSITRPTNPYEGQTIYETDTDRFVGYNGSSWQTAAQLTGWTTYTPTLTQSGAVTKTVTYAKYVQIGKTVTATVKLDITGIGTANNTIICTLPVIGAVSNNFVIGSGGVFDSSVSTFYYGVTYVTSTTTFGILLCNGAVGNLVGGVGGGMTAALASGDIFTATVTYEAV